MVQVTLPNEKFLRREFVVPKVFEIMEPYLAFLDILPKVRADSRAVRYKQETVSASSDTKKQTPRKRSPGSKWTYLDITQMSIYSALLNQEGFAIRIDEDAVQYTEGVDEINRAYNKVAFWLAEHLNTQIGSALTGGATSPTWTPNAVWSAATATPVDDLIRLEAEMEREGYPYVMTDIYIEKTNFYELKAYLTSIDISDAKQRDIYGMPKVDRDTILIPVVGSTIHKLLSGISHGYVLALDKANPAGTFYYNNNPKYASEKISYRKSDGTVVTVPNIGFNFHQYVDNETHDTVMQFWMDHITVVKEPYAALYKTGI